MAEIRLEDIKPNSNYSKTNANNKNVERKKMSPLKRKGKIVSAKKSFSKRMWDLFVGEDPKELVKSFVNNVLIPGLKNSVLDALSMAFYGETITRGKSLYSRTKTSYSNFYKSPSKKSVSNRPNFEKEEKIDYKRIILDNRLDAEDLVDHMKDRIVDTGSISIAEFFDLLELPSKWTDTEWGWDDDRDIGIKVVSNGFLIDVAEAKRLE